MAQANETLKGQLVRMADYFDRMYYNRHNKVEDRIIIELETMCRKAAKLVPEDVKAL